MHPPLPRTSHPHSPLQPRRPAQRCRQPPAFAFSCNGDIPCRCPVRQSRTGRSSKAPSTTGLALFHSCIVSFPPPIAHPLTFFPKYGQEFVSIRASIISDFGLGPLKRPEPSGLLCLVCILRCNSREALEHSNL